VVQHSKLGASSSHRWLQCTASVAAESSLNEPQVSDAARMGTIAHDLAQGCLLGTDDLSSCNDIDMRRCVGTYLDYVEEYTYQFNFVERKVFYTQWVADGYGYADFISYDLETRTLHVIDLKTGRNIVSAENNSQLRLYALGALQTLAKELPTEPVRFELHICQPTKSHIESEVLSLEQLLEFGEYAKQKALEVELNPSYQPSEVACKYCKFKSKCRALLGFTEQVLLTDDFKELNPSTLGEDDIANIIKHKGLIEGFLKAVVEQAEANLKEGGQIKGVKLIRGRGSRAWIDPQKVESHLKTLIPHDQLYTTSIKSLTSIETLLGRKKFNSECGKLVHKRSGRLKAAHESDKGEKVDMTPIEDDFKDI